MADIWACGVILFFMLTGQRPFDDESVHKLLDKIIIGNFKFPNEQKKLSEDSKDLIKNILNPNPRKRFNFEQIKMHRWFLQDSDVHEEEEENFEFENNWSASEIQDQNHFIEGYSNVGGVISNSVSPSNRGNI